MRRDVIALLALGAAVLALGLALAWAIAGSLSRPLRGLARTARRIAGGDLQARAVPTGSSEQVEVANAFNDMTERLVRALDAQRDFVANASHQLRTPLTGLRLRLEAASLKADDPDLAATSPPASVRPSASRSCSPTSCASPRTASARRRRRSRSPGAPRAPPSAGATRPSRTATRSSSRATATRACSPRPATSTRCSTT